MAIKLASSTLSSPTRHVQTYETFRGVDLTHSKIEVEGYRAVDMRNFIMENESNTKRYGWEELYRFKNDNNYINGIWLLDSTYPIINDDGEIIEYKKESIILVQVDADFYTIKDFGKEIETSNSLDKVIALNDNIEKIEVSESIKSKIDITKKSEAFVRGNRLYILCGTFLVFGKWATNDKWTGNEKYQIKEVRNEAYIPTILTKVVCNGSSYLDSETAFSTNVPLDDINMLTDNAYITLLGEEESSPNQSNLKFSLNIGQQIFSVKSIKANGLTIPLTEFSFDRSKQELTLEKNYIPEVSGVDNIEVFVNLSNTGNYGIIENCKFGLVYGYNGSRDRLFVSGNSDYPNMLWHSRETGGSEESDFTYFSPNDYIKLGNTNNSIMGMYIQGNGSMVVLKSPSSQEPTIYFINATMIQATDYAGNVIKGLDGETLYEEAYPVQIGSIGVGLKKRNGIYNLNGDPLMISDNGIYGIVLGENVASEQRYAKLRSRLIDNAITQINDLENTACICFKNKFYIADTDTGKCYIADARYPTKLGDDLADTYQYEWWIWDNIYARLFFEYKEELYMATDIGQICKFKNKNYKDISYREITEGSIFYDIDKGLFLLDVDNTILNFNTWAEYEKLHNEDRLNFNEDLGLKILVVDKEDIKTINSRITIRKNSNNEKELKEYLYLKTVLFILQTSYINEDNVEKLEGIYSVFLDNINPTITGLSTGKRYIIRDVICDENNDYFEISFRLSDPIQCIPESENMYKTIANSNNPFRISMDIPKELTISDLQTQDGLLFSRCFQDTQNYWYYYDENDNIISLNTTERPLFNYFALQSFETNNENVKVIQYNDVSLMDELGVKVPSVLTINDNIVSYYYTTWFNLGTDVYLKNLINVYVVPDPLAANRVSFAFETSRKKAEYDAYTGKTFDFNDLDFNDVSFTTNQIPMVYQKKFKTKKFTYIRFIFKNSDNNNCKLARVTIEYTTSARVKGEK